MEKSKINNPAIKEIWDRSIWTGQPQTSMLLRYFFAITLALLFIVGAGFILWFLNTLNVDWNIRIICLVVFFVLFMAINIISAITSRWTFPTLMFALSGNRLFFTIEHDAKLTEYGSWCEATMDEIASFTLKTNGGKTTLILNFFEKFYAGTYGKTKALPLYRISNAQQLISILKGFGIKEEKK
jgi:hypothetical protein